MRKAGEEMNPGDRSRHRARPSGRPERLDRPQAPARERRERRAPSWLNPEPNLSGPGGFDQPEDARGVRRGPARQPDRVRTRGDRRTGAAAQAAAHAARHGRLDVEPLDNDLAEALIPKGVHVIQEPHIGTGISTTFVVNWGTLSAASGQGRAPRSGRRLHRRQRRLPDGRARKAAKCRAAARAGPRSTPTACARS